MLPLNPTLPPGSDRVADARRALGPAKPGAGSAPPASGVTFFTQSGTVNETQSCCLPPDGDIATSANWMMQTVNDQIAMYNWNTNVYMQKSFATFFQDSIDFIFD